MREGLAAQAAGVGDDHPGLAVGGHGIAPTDFLSADFARDHKPSLAVSDGNDARQVANTVTCAGFEAVMCDTGFGCDDRISQRTAFGEMDGAIIGDRLGLGIVINEGGCPDHGDAEWKARGVAQM